MSTCVCGHAKEQHIYHEGACRPGFVCPDGCKEFRPAHATGSRAAKTPFQRVVDDLSGDCGCACHTGTGYRTSCEHCRPHATPDRAANTDLTWVRREAWERAREYLAASNPTAEKSYPGAFDACLRDLAIQTERLMRLAERVSTDV